MKTILLLILSLVGLMSLTAEASHIFNPGGSSTLTDANGCIWAIGNTIDTSGVVSTTLISCPGASSAILAELTGYILQENSSKILTE